jgi:hypothetical protein
VTRTCIFYGANNEQALIREAVAAAMKQDARAESSHPALVDRLAERRIEAMAVRSVMNQLQRTESNRHFLVAQDGTPDGPGPREWGTELAQVPNGGRMEQLAMIPLSMSSPLIKVIPTLFLSPLSSLLSPLSAPSLLLCFW